MSSDDIAAAVLECVGGFGNVTNNSLCATRLRISLRDASHVDRNALHSINGVLGIADRGSSGIEVVFGPNLVRSVYQSFVRLTGPKALEARRDAGTVRPQGNFQVKITPETPGRPQVQTAVMHATTAPIPVEDSDTNALLERLSQAPDAVDDEPQPDAGDASSEEIELGAHLLVLNGPNVNMLGLGNNGSYGDVDFSVLLDLCHVWAKEAGFSGCECYQSNHEGDLIDRVQDACELFDALLINAGGYAYTSIALLDAVALTDIPTVEVQLTRPYEDEGLPWQSYVGRACLKTITDATIEGYHDAIELLGAHLGLKDER